MEELFGKVSVEIEVYVTKQDIDDIVCTALEGGIKYWCSSARVGEIEYFGDYASDQISRGGTLVLTDDEEGDEYVLTGSRLMNGIKMYLQNPDKPYEITTSEKGKVVLDCCNVDAVVADMIIQYAIFGEIVYG